jgi:DNA polymerase-3 subunit gamma/tau
MSTFVVSARKYRPQQFEDVVGQQHVTNTLKNALKNDHLAHAFLFCGPRGVGKTTCARILAKVLNCEHIGENYEPCNTCNSCQAFNKNASFNITELDAASNNSVEHIRALIEQVRFQPQQGKYKVFIIDEVHMLSQQAFNAFLKTLEEPPSYAIFILATTEKHKIIPTILSRCQIFDFKRIQVASMVAHLESICRDEGIQADQEALHVIAQKADGALRDALSIFDRIVSFSGKQISYQDVIENLNVLDYDYYFQLVDALLIEDHAQTLLLFNKIVNLGFDPDVFLAGLSEHLRNLLVAKDPQTMGLLELSDGLKERYLLQAAKSSNTFLLSALNLANECDIHYKMARNKRLHVEMALIKMSHIERVVRASSISADEKKKISTESAPLPSTVAGQDQKTPPLSKEEPSKEEIPSSVSENGSPEMSETATPEPQPEPVEAAAPSVQMEGEEALLTAPSLSDMDSMLQQIREEEAQKDPVQPNYELNQDNVIQLWKQHVDAIQQDSTRSILQQSEISLEDHTVVVMVSSKLVENMVRQEQGVVQLMRTEFAKPDLKFEIRIDPSKISEAPKSARPLTDKEKLRQMFESNPEVKTLTQRFGLRFDD